MRRLLIKFVLLAAVLSLIVSLIAVFATTSVPSVDRQATISPDSVASAKRLFRLNDPRRMQAGQARRIAVPAQLIDEGLNHLATRFLDGRATLQAEAGRARIGASIPLPLLPVRRYINFQASFLDDGRQLQLNSIDIGGVPLPPQAALPLIGLLANLSGHGDEWQMLVQTIGKVRLNGGGRYLMFDIVWQPELLQRARAMALPEANIAPLEAAQRDLAALLGFRAQNRALALTDVLKPMLNLNGEAIPERRRAALLVMASYLAGKNLSSVIPEAASWPRPAPRLLTIHGREDSAQHFIISAALSAWAGEPIADAIGLYKELEDARSGSGFSFADLAADRAGTRFGRVLVDQPERIDALLKAPLKDDDLVPALNDLPEFISEAEFRRRFGSIDSPAYRNLIDEVERRIDGGTLYR